MSFRRRLLGVFAVTVVAAIGAVAWIVSLRTRDVFERADAERTTAIVKQVQAEIDRRGEEVAQRVAAVASGETAARMALDVSHGGDPSAYVNAAASEAQAHQLDFLEFLSGDGSIVSSAQWPARFGYKDVLPESGSGSPYLKAEELPNASALGIFASRTVNTGEQPLYVVGGERLDSDFLAHLSLPPGMRAFLYRAQEGGFSASALVSTEASLPDAAKLSPVIARVEQSGRDSSQIVHWTSDPADAEGFNAFPLKANNGKVIGVLLIGNSRRGLVELQHHIRAVALTVAGFAILVAILVSIWLSARITRPVVDLAQAARSVAGGNWDTHVEVPNTEELGDLAEAFNTMTREIIDQRERLLQAERVAAWRELARRLAHELKNPLFPLQITVENLLRSRELPAAEFDEVFRESASTLLAEISHLKTIVGRFSDFSKMPQPQLQNIDINEVLRKVIALHEPQLSAPGRPAISMRSDLAGDLPKIDADPDLLHRVFSNLVLNAMDAMPQGGTITVRTRNLAEAVRIEVADTGTGLTPEECARIFTPYYTSKQHGTGLGLAIVQSVISDHKGTITVESEPGKGATFRVDLPKYQTLALRADTAKIG